MPLVSVAIKCYKLIVSSGKNVPSEVYMIATVLLARRDPSTGAEQVYLPCLPRTSTVFVDRLQHSGRTTATVAATQFCRIAFGLDLRPSRFIIISSDFQGSSLVLAEPSLQEQLDMVHSRGPAPLPDQITPWTNLSAALGLGHSFLDSAMQQAVLLLSDYLQAHPLGARNCPV